MARYKILDQHGLNFVTLTVVDWVDVFIRKQFTAKRITQDLEKNTYESRRDWMLWHFKNQGKQNSNNKNYQFWQKGNHPILLFSPKVIRQKFAYIHTNPVVQVWVIHPEDYWYSSALYYLERQGPLEVDILDLGVTEGFFMPKFK